MLSAHARPTGSHLVELAGHFGGPGRDEQFELLLDLYVEGVAQRVAR